MGGGGYRGNRQAITGDIAIYASGDGGLLISQGTIGMCFAELMVHEKL